MPPSKSNKHCFQAVHLKKCLIIFKFEAFQKISTKKCHKNKIIFYTKKFNLNISYYYNWVLKRSLDWLKSRGS